MADTAAPTREAHSPAFLEDEHAHSTAGAALDLLLTEAGLGTRERFLPGRETLRFMTRLARRPGRVVRRSSALTEELAKVVAGRSELKPPRGDRRFLDPAWSDSWIYRRLLQAYLAVDETVDGVIDDAELDWADDRKLRFIAQSIVDALAPANAPLVNPEVLKGTIDTGGRNFVRGARQFARDMREPPRLPANVDVSKFAVGRNLGLSPGAVVLRDERFELIQYQPTTPEVRAVPILLVPPMINKFYIMDLAPGRSHIEHLLQSGQQVFTISWRNPRAEHRGWGLDAYADAVLEAFDAVLDISGSDRAHVLGYCAGGLVAAATISHLAAVGRLEQVASVTLGVCVIDNEHSNVVGAFATEQIKNVALAASMKKGYLDGRDLASVFLWLRPNDLIWPYVVNNWLLGKEPPAFDILYWNADTTRMPAALHRDFLELATAELDAPARWRHGAGLAGRPRHDHGRQLRRRGSGGPHQPLAELLRDDAAARRPHALRAVHQRAHRGHRQPARQQASHLPDRRRADTARPRTVGGARDHEPGNLVDGLGRVARGALGWDAPRARADRKSAAQAGRRGTRGVRPRAVRRCVPDEASWHAHPGPRTISVARGTRAPAPLTSPPPPGGRGGHRP